MLRSAFSRRVSDPAPLMFLLLPLLLWLSPACALPATAAEPVQTVAEQAPGAATLRHPHLAFYYGINPPVDELRLFDQVVVQPNQLLPEEERALLASGPVIVAYVSIGEVARNSVDWPKIDQGWVRGENPMWKTAVMDYSQAAWRDYLIEQHFLPLWQKGYRAFFLDTVDSYELVLPPVPAEWNTPGAAEARATQAQARERQEAGLEALLAGVKQRFAGVQLIFNRGFAVLPRVHRFADGFVAETLYAGYHANTRDYFTETPERTQWLLGKVREVQERWRIPVTIIDYLPPGQWARAEQLARDIRALGFGVWIANGDLNMLGQGVRRNLPRRLLALYDGPDALPDQHPLHRSLALLLEQEGYVLDYRHVERQPLPPETFAGRYAGVVAWLSARSQGQQPGLCARLKTEADAGVKTVFLSQLPAGPACDNWLGSSANGARAGEGLTLVQGDKRLALGQFEAPMRMRQRDLADVRAPGGAEIWLQLRDAAGRHYEPAFVAGFGGALLQPWLLDDAGPTPAWLVHPWPLISRALQLPALPAPDPHTELGRRSAVLMAVADGLGTRAGDTPAADAGTADTRAADTGSRSGEQLLALLRDAGLPFTLAVAEGELRGSDDADTLARNRLLQQFAALPGAELAGHSYSHPFSWRAFEGDSRHAHVRYFYTLPQPGYLAELEREIGGAVQGLSAVLPAVNRSLYVWPGDAEPGPAPLATAQRAGLQTFGGGGLRHTGPQLHTSDLAPLLRRTPWGTQIRAPLADETTWSLLTGGEALNARRLLDWNRQTGQPRRKPWWFYLHADAYSRPGSVALFRELLQASREENLLWMTLGDWLERVKGFETAAIGRDLDGNWLLSGRGVRSWRTPAVLGWPQPAAAGHVGVSDSEAGRHLAVSDDVSLLRFAAQRSEASQLVEADQRLDQFVRDGRQLRLRLRGPGPATLVFRHGRDCELRAGSDSLKARVRAGLFSYSLSAEQATQELSLVCAP